MIALPYNEYLQRYGAARESMAAVVVEARANGARIPWSYWYDRPITADEYLDTRVLSDPICMYDCDIPVDGVAAFVFTTAERARDLRHPPVYVAGYGQGHPDRHRLPMHWPLDDIMDVAAETCARLWEHSGLSVDDVDVPQLYDGFSPFIYFWLEALGYCPVGEAHRFVQDGGIRAPTAGSRSSPVAAHSATAGCTASRRCSSATCSSSGRAGERQLPSANVGLACHSSPHWGGAVLYSREPL